MSEQPRTKKVGTQDRKGPLKQSEKAMPKKPQVQGSRLKKAAPDKKQRIIMIVMIVLAAVMVIAAALVLLHNRLFKKPDLPSGPIQSDSGSVPSPSVGPGSTQDPGPEVTQDIITVQPLASGERKSKDFFTILIFGSDTSSGLTDTIMVASYDVTNQKATVLSIPRDTLINNRYLDKANKSINATYKQNGKGEKGVSALKTEVSRLIGFVPDYYVTINWELVGQMVDAIGGVYFDIPWHMGYDDPYQNLHIHFEKGNQYLDGEAAMNLVRWRKNNDGTSSHGGSDLGRLNVQHSFLKAVLKQTLQPQNIVRIPELIRLFNENVVSDLAVENMLWFGEQAVLGSLSVDDVEFINLPVYATENTSGRYYGKYCPIINQLLKVVNSSLNPYVEDVTLQQLDLIQMSTDGNILSSTTGTLRNPASGVFEYPDDPIESDPGATDPTESNPGATDPTESNPGATDPTESDPGTTDPTESDPGTADPTESDPGTTDPAESDPGAAGPAGDDPDPGQADDPPPETGPALPGGDGPDDGDWGYTPD